MDESILTSVKEQIGIVGSYEHFDPQLIAHINTTFLILHQLGIGPSTGFAISDDTAVWSDFLGSDGLLLGMVKSYVPMKVRMLFDVPTSSAVKDAMKENLTELEWRMREMKEIFM